MILVPSDDPRSTPAADDLARSAGAGFSRKENHDASGRENAMNPLVIHPGAAHQLLQAMLIGWAAIEVVLRLRNIGGRTTLDWTFGLVVASVFAATNLGFRAAQVHSTVFGGGWAPVAAGLAVLAAGVALRIWAILTLGRFFKFVVVIQDGHHVIDSGPYRLLRHPSYSGALIAFLGAGIALDSWLSMLALLAIPLAAVLARIRVEERQLAAALGNQYTGYAARTSRLVPGLW
jgi:protein-S-isoprenylcysteine O-methyltransferase Ste14